MEELSENKTKYFRVYVDGFKTLDIKVEFYQSFRDWLAKYMMTPDIIQVELINDDKKEIFINRNYISGIEEINVDDE